MKVTIKTLSPKAEPLWERDFGLSIDAVAFIPAKGDLIRLPGQRKERRVHRVTRAYEKDRLRWVKVEVVDAS